MRKPYTQFTLVCFLIVTAFLSSCSIRGTIGSSFNTRKYTPGYYFNVAGNKGKTNSYTQVRKIVARPNSTMAKPVVPENKETDHRELTGNVNKVNSIAATSSIVLQTATKAKSSLLSSQLKDINDNNKGDHDWADQERKDRKVNILLALASIVLGIGGIYLLGSISFGAGAVCIVVGTVLSVIGLKRGSSSLFTFIGFIINVIGLIILIDYALVNGI